MMNVTRFDHFSTLLQQMLALPEYQQRAFPSAAQPPAPMNPTVPVWTAANVSMIVPLKPVATDPANSSIILSVTRLHATNSGIGTIPVPLPGGLLP